MTILYDCEMDPSRCDLIRRALWGRCLPSSCRGPPESSATTVRAKATGTEGVVARCPVVYFQNNLSFIPVRTPVAKTTELKEIMFT